MPFPKLLLLESVIQNIIQFHIVSLNNISLYHQLFGITNHSIKLQWTEQHRSRIPQYYRHRRQGEITGT